MTDEQIQERVLVFLNTRGGYVAGASERELFLMVKAAVETERERCAQILLTKAGASTRHGSMLVDDDDPDVPRRLYAAAIRNIPDE